MFFSVCINIFYWNKNEHTNERYNNKKASKRWFHSFIQALFHSSNVCVRLRCTACIEWLLRFCSILCSVLFYISIYFDFSTQIDECGGKTKTLHAVKINNQTALNTNLLHVYGCRCMCIWRKTRKHDMKNMVFLSLEFRAIFTLLAGIHEIFSKHFSYIEVPFWCLFSNAHWTFWWCVESESYEPKSAYTVDVPVRVFVI